LVAPRGKLILSGILAHLATDVAAAAEQRGLKLIESKQIGGWVALLVENPAG